MFLHNAERRPSFGLHHRGFLTALIMMFRVIELSPRMLLFYVIIKEAAATGRQVDYSFIFFANLTSKRTLDSDVLSKHIHFLVQELHAWTYITPFSRLADIVGL